MSAMGDFGIWRMEMGIPIDAPITRKQVDAWRREDCPSPFGHRHKTATCAACAPSEAEKAMVYAAIEAGDN
jgi:hypothetical protein